MHLVVLSLRKICDLFFKISQVSLFFPALLRYNWHQWSIWTFYVAQEEWFVCRPFFRSSNVLVQKRILIALPLFLSHIWVPPSSLHIAPKTSSSWPFTPTASSAQSLLGGSWWACLVSPYLWKRKNRPCPRGALNKIPQSEGRVLFIFKERIN